MPHTREELDKMFNELPDDVREAMASIDTVTVLKEIKEKYNLHIDQAGELSAEIGMLMLGAIPPQKFISNIQNTLGIPKETAHEITTIVNEKIFQKIRASLMAIHQMDEEKTINAQIQNKIKEELKKTITDPYKEAI